MASCSSRTECNVQELGGGLTVLEALGDDAEGERLHARHGFVAVLAVAHHTREARHFSKPAAVVLSFDFDRKGHAGQCTIRAGCSTRRWTRMMLGEGRRIARTMDATASRR